MDLVYQEINFNKKEDSIVYIFSGGFQSGKSMMIHAAKKINMVLTIKEEDKKRIIKPKDD